MARIGEVASCPMMEKQVNASRLETGSRLETSQQLFTNRQTTHYTTAVYISYRYNLVEISLLSLEIL